MENDAASRRCAQFFFHPPLQFPLGVSVSGMEKNGRKNRFVIFFLFYRPVQKKIKEKNGRVVRFRYCSKNGGNGDNLLRY